MAEKKDHSGNLLWRLLATLFAGANVCTVCLLWVCVLSTYLSPAKVPYLHLMGLAFPFFLVANVLFFVMWLIFKARYACIPLVGVLSVWGYVMDYCPVSVGSDVADDAVCILSYNVGGMKAEKLPSLDSLVREVRPDIVCLQECPGSSAATNMLQSWQDSLGYTMCKDKSRVTLSRFPFVGKPPVIEFPSKEGGNGTLFNWVLIGADTVLLANNHLESNRLTEEDKSEYDQMIYEHQKEQIRQSGRMISRKLGNAAVYRGQQTDSLVSCIKRHDGCSMIFCGDFNDTPISYTFQSLRRRLESAYTEKGDGLSFSYNRKLFYVRIDHLFFTPDWECQKCYVDNTVDTSDHYPLVTYLHRKQK